MPMSSQAARAKREAARNNRPTHKAHFDQGYLRLPGAAVWEGAPARPETPSKRKTRWARTPWNTPLGLCLAVGHQEDGSFVVCTEHKGVRTWRAWKEMEDLVGVRRWVQRCF